MLRPLLNKQRKINKYNVWHVTVNCKIACISDIKLNILSVLGELVGGCRNKWCQGMVKVFQHISKHGSCSFQSVRKPSIIDEIECHSYEKQWTRIVFSATGNLSFSIKLNLFT